MKLQYLRRELSLFVLAFVVCVLVAGLVSISRSLADAKRSYTASDERAPGLIEGRLPEMAGMRSVQSGSLHIDSSVRPASALAVLPLAGAAVGNGEFSVTKVAQDLNGSNSTYQWDVTSGTQTIELLRATPIVIEGTGGSTDQFLAVQIDGKEVGTRQKITDGTPWQVSVESQPSGRHVLEVGLYGAQGDAEPIQKTRSLAVIVPVTEAPLPPVVSFLSNTAFGDKNQTADGEVHIYNRFLRLKGEQLDQRTQLSFVVFEKDDNGFTFRREANVISFARGAGGAWTASIRLPDSPLGSAGRLAVFARQAGSHSVAAKQASFVLTSSVNPLAVPGRPTITDGRGQRNTKTFEVTTQTETLQDGWVVFFVDGVGQPFPAETRTGSPPAWKSTIQVQDDGVHQIVAAAVVGDLTDKRSAPVEVQIRTSKPRVTNVTPTNLALAKDGRQIVVRFNRENTLANTSEKIIVANISSPADGSLKDVLSQTPFTLTPSSTTTTPGLQSVEYDRSTNSLTLTYDGEFPPDEYTLTIQNIRDIFGNTMDGPHTAQLIMPVGAETPATSRGITGPQAPYVEYQEYTKPRPIIDGFNPSDHVETRVSRLYYYRDAHRVAQIINREAKSYNRAAVEMQQQLAERARTIADQATDDRRSKERRAVEAAQQARQAERQLQEAEAGVQRASNEALQAQLAAQRLQQNPPPGMSPEQLQQAVERRNAATRTAEQVAAARRREAQAAFQRVQSLRSTEAELTEEWQDSIAVEDRAREDQFRREVAAANEDPDTFAPGLPGSKDPVRQVSVSVIGEGLIQLRGPMKGINIIRTMINQMDAPVGQVRVGVHTVQINGEHGDRMERVAGRIQRYIDHSRFLTMQSAEMLRKAIVEVAAAKAAQIGHLTLVTQEDRDRRYLYAFFGEDFIRELEAMDSEFLKTGNKLLSLHSMDSTSLASALFIMALAKNTTRLEILDVFERMMMSDLPIAEQNYFEAGLTSDGRHKLFEAHHDRDQFQILAENARFQSIRGFFDVQVAAPNIMTPIQREFVRLAQIFKSRLIVEMELKQRIMERAIIEERLGDHLKELKKARDKEKAANDILNETNRAIKEAQKHVLASATELHARVDSTRQQAREAVDAAARVTSFVSDLLRELERPFYLGNTFEEERTRLQGLQKKYKTEGDWFKSDGLSDIIKNLVRAHDKGRDLILSINESRTLAEKLRAHALRMLEWRVQQIEVLRSPAAAAQFKKVNESSYRDKPIRIDFKWKGQAVRLMVTKQNGSDRLEVTAGQNVLMPELKRLADTGKRIRSLLKRFEYDAIRAKELERAGKLLDGLSNEAQPIMERIARGRIMLVIYGSLAEHVLNRSSEIHRNVQTMVAELGSDDVNIADFYRRWLTIQDHILGYLKQDYRAEVAPIFTGVSEALQGFVEKELDYQVALKNAELARRPLDHKKFLDMLVDEMEDKYIELLEGTRAHTANIDAYIKRLMTALDDDFNTQFYYPAFREVRGASRMYDVSLGQVETTTILANNRGFAKVEPQATMEFDLPKRQTVIAEAMNGAKAAMDDFGALAQDPTFLAMSKLNSGQSTATPGMGATGGLSTVRNVLPGLSTDTAESVMGQQGPGGAQFGAALEGLIPDPAIYKFETGTGFEIRPVIQPDGQAVVFNFNYMYSTNVREPVRADEKHLGRIKRHFVHTDVQLSNFELREVSRYTVALKASRTSRGVPLLEDIPLLGTLFRPLPSAESSLQQNLIMAQTTIFPTLFDLMGLRWAPAVADLDPLRLSNDEFIVRNRRRVLMNRVFDHSSSEVDKFLRIPEGERRMDLYRSQETIPSVHPNGYEGPGANLRESQLREGYDPTDRPTTEFIPGSSNEGSVLRNQRPHYMDEQWDAYQEAGEPVHEPPRESRSILRHPDTPPLPPEDLRRCPPRQSELPLDGPDLVRPARYSSVAAPSNHRPPGVAAVPYHEFIRQPARPRQATTDQRPPAELRRIPVGPAAGRAAHLPVSPR